MSNLYMSDVEEESNQVQNLYVELIVKIKILLSAW